MSQWKHNYISRLSLVTRDSLIKSWEIVCKYAPSRYLDTLSYTNFLLTCSVYLGLTTYRMALMNASSAQKDTGAQHTIKHQSNVWMLR